MCCGIRIPPSFCARAVRTLDASDETYAQVAARFEVGAVPCSDGSAASG
jgi:hypothetical protein